jgi:beta-carotene ketolase (CrtO type)
MDPTAAPAGEATMWANAFTTHRLSAGRSWDAVADEFRARLWETVEACLPGVRSHAVEEVLTSPDDLTRRTGALNAGSHLAPTLRQSLGGRPAPGLAGHRALVGLYLSGAGTNPGGGVSGLPGRATAQRVLTDLAGGVLGHRRLVALARRSGAQLAAGAKAVSAARAAGRAASS